MVEATRHRFADICECVGLECNQEGQLYYDCGTGRADPNWCDIHSKCSVFKPPSLSSHCLHSLALFSAGSRSYSGSPSAFPTSVICFTCTSPSSCQPTNKVPCSRHQVYVQQHKWTGTVPIPVPTIRHRQTQRPRASGRAAESWNGNATSTCLGTNASSAEGEILREWNIQRGLI